MMELIDLFASDPEILFFGFVSAIALFGLYRFASKRSD